ncbi:uncharacterized protein LOC113005569 [Solenopsis invicta]|uniref:uncharacterized protein LOC113005569 n=1 Tax=Solenopsis invicta TaxID=13686 RepID=UPI000E33E157|nr:uncharacterized protein LOC113005569 [Solenopsis invicta]
MARECRKKKHDNKTSAEGANASDCAFIVSTNQKGAKNGECLDKLGRQLLSSDIRDIWIADSGASRHITFRLDWFTEFQARDGDTVALGDDGICEAKGTGTICIETMINGVWTKSRLENVLYVPALRKNLFSIISSVGKGYRVVFNQEHVIPTR